MAVSPGVPAARRRVRRDACRPRHAAPALRSVRAQPGVDGAPGAGLATRQRAARDPRERRDLQRVRRPAGHRSALGAGHGTAARVGGRMEPARRGVDSADAAAQFDPARSARSTAAPAERAAASVAGAGQSGVSPPLPRHSCAARHLPAHARRGPGANAGWSVGGACRSDAGAVGRRLRARKPDRAAAQPSGSVSQRPHSPAGLLLPRAARLSDRADADSGPARQGRAADAGTVQRDVLRTRVPGAVPRLHAGRGRRPDGARSPRLHQDTRGSSAGQRHFPPARRQLLRSARAPRRLVPRRRRPRRRRPRRQRRRRQRARLRRDRDGRDPAFSACALPRAARRGVDASVGAHVVVRTAGASVVRAGASPRPGGQAGVSVEGTGARIRATAQRARTTRTRGGHPRHARGLCRSGARGAVECAGVAPPWLGTEGGRASGRMWPRLAIRSR